MDATKRLDDYLAKSREAEEHAAKCKDDCSRKAWKALAEGYRYLAGSEMAMKDVVRREHGWDVPNE
jgi:hypothetical protein